ncbi:MAG: hypothetical protein P3T54_08295 [Dehalogenimonas sp.]|uniref:Uncharacterized protein n=1 Tax=Candidatus Dehalogenimonas loeffleri TaxID=3127115 RepID=A0ABZ2J3A8_9CHLR|nr:hypothetical protein [Dehalogenimonas sp.]
MLTTVSCIQNNDDILEIKSSETLLQEINLRLEQLEKPSEDRYKTMSELGLNLDDLSIQRVFIYLNDLPTLTQQQELESLGITLYLNSWIPPVGVHPAGFLIAKVPVENIDELAAKDYVIKLDSAERESEPHSKPG